MHWVKAQEDTIVKAANAMCAERGKPCKSFTTASSATIAPMHASAALTTSNNTTKLPSSWASARARMRSWLDQNIMRAASTR